MVGLFFLFNFFSPATCQPTEFQGEQFSEVAPDSLISNPTLPPYVHPAPPHPSTQPLQSTRQSVTGHMVEPIAPGSPFKPTGRLKLWQRGLGAERKPTDISKEWSGIRGLTATDSTGDERVMMGYREREAKRKVKME